jgi:hypothetical protein
MKRSWVVYVLGAIVFLGPTVAFAEDSIGQDLRELVLQGLQATQNEDAGAVLQTIHSQSPAYNKITEQLPRIFADYDIKYDLLSYVYLGSDNEYAVARITQTAEKVNQKPEAPRFQNNKADIIQVFRKENEIWKFWNQVILEFELSEK